MRYFFRLAGVLLIFATPLSAADKITFYHGMGGAFAKGAMDRLIYDFNQENRGRSGFLPVKAVAYPSYIEVNLQLKALGKSAAGPDVVQIASELLFSCVKAGQLEPLDPYLKRDKELLADIPPVMLNLATPGQSSSTLYAFPFNISVLVMYYNMDMFADIGIKERIKSWTWNQMVEICKIIKKKKQKAAIVWPADPYTVIPLVWSNNSDFFGVDLNAKDAYAKNLQALKLWTDLFRAYDVMPENLTLKEAITKFGVGQVAMGPNTCGGLKFAMEQSEPRVGVAPLPVIKTPVTYIGGGLLGLAAKEKGDKKIREAALLFIKWMASPQVQARWHKETGYLPVRKSVLSSGDLAQFHRQNPNFKVGIEQLPYAKAPAVDYNVLGLRDSFINNLSSLLNNVRTTPEQALDKIIVDVGRAKY